MAIYLGYDRVGIIKYVKVPVRANVITLTGTYTFTMNNVVGKEVDELTVKGNSIQNGTPTPETPIEIESVGERTHNLFDLKNASFGRDTAQLVERGDNYFIIEPTASATHADAGSTFWGSGWIPLMFNPFEDGKTYTISYDVEVIEKVVDYNFPINQRIMIYDTNDTILHRFDCAVSELNKTYHYSKTVTVTNFLRFIITCNSSRIKISNFQVIEGSGEKDYEPYGYKVPVKVGGKNLIPNTLFKATTKNGITLEPREDGTVRVYGTATADAVFNPKVYGLQPNTYCLSGCPSGGSNTTYRFLAYFMAPTYNLVEHGEGKSYKLTTESDAVIEIKVYAGQTVDLIYKPMLEVGSVKTEYEPYVEPVIKNIYLNEPLRKIGEYADYIDYKNKKVVRNVAEYAFKGTEVLNQLYETNTAGQYRIFLSIPNGLKGNVSNKVAVLSNLYAAGTADSTYIRKQSVGLHANGYVVVYDANYQTIESFKTFVSERYNSDTPFIVYYPTATQTEETIDVPFIKLRDGTNNLTIDTKVAPSETQITYWEEIIDG